MGIILNNKYIKAYQQGNVQSQNNNISSSQGEISRGNFTTNNIVNPERLDNKKSKTPDGVIPFAVGDGEAFNAIKEDNQNKINEIVNRSKELKKDANGAINNFNESIKDVIFSTPAVGVMGMYIPAQGGTIEDIVSNVSNTISTSDEVGNVASKVTAGILGEKYAGYKVKMPKEYFEKYDGNEINLQGKVVNGLDLATKYYTDLAVNTLIASHKNYNYSEIYNNIKNIVDRNTVYKKRTSDGKLGIFFNDFSVGSQENPYETIQSVTKEVVNSLKANYDIDYLPVDYDNLLKLYKESGINIKVGEDSFIIPIKEIKKYAKRNGDYYEFNMGEVLADYAINIKSPDEFYGVSTPGLTKGISKDDEKLYGVAEFYQTLYNNIDSPRLWGEAALTLGTISSFIPTPVTKVLSVALSAVGTGAVAYGDFTDDRTSSSMAWSDLGYNTLETLLNGLVSGAIPVKGLEGIKALSRFTRGVETVKGVKALKAVYNISKPIIGAGLFANSAYNFVTKNTDVNSDITAMKKFQEINEMINIAAFSYGAGRSLFRRGAKEISMGAKEVTREVKSANAETKESTEGAKDANTEGQQAANTTTGEAINNENKPSVFIQTFKNMETKGSKKLSIVKYIIAIADEYNIGYPDKVETKNKSFFVRPDNSSKLSVYYSEGKLPNGDLIKSLLKENTKIFMSTDGIFVSVLDDKQSNSMAVVKITDDMFNNKNDSNNRNANLKDKFFNLLKNIAKDYQTNFNVLYMDNYSRVVEDNNNIGFQVEYTKALNLNKSYYIDKNGNVKSLMDFANESFKNDTIKSGNYKITYGDGVNVFDNNNNIMKDVEIYSKRNGGIFALQNGKKLWDQNIEPIYYGSMAMPNESTNDLLSTVEPFKKQINPLSFKYLYLPKNIRNLFFQTIDKNEKVKGSLTPQNVSVKTPNTNNEGKIKSTTGTTEETEGNKKNSNSNTDNNNNKGWNNGFFKDMNWTNIAIATGTNMLSNFLSNRKPQKLLNEYFNENINNPRLKAPVLFSPYMPSMALQPRKTSESEKRAYNNILLNNIPETYTNSLSQNRNIKRANAMKLNQEQTKFKMNEIASVQQQEAQSANMALQNLANTIKTNYQNEAARYQARVADATNYKNFLQSLQQNTINMATAKNQNTVNSIQYLMKLLMNKGNYVPAYSGYSGYSSYNELLKKIKGLESKNS